MYIYITGLTTFNTIDLPYNRLKKEKTTSHDCIQTALFSSEVKPV